MLQSWHFVRAQWDTLVTEQGGEWLQVAPPATLLSIFPSRSMHRTWQTNISTYFRPWNVGSIFVAFVCRMMHSETENCLPLGSVYPYLKSL